MPPNRTSGATQKSKAFKPPRPTSKATSTSKAATARQKRRSKAPSSTPSSSDDSNNSEIESSHAYRSSAQVSGRAELEDQPPVIPEKLLQVLLKQHFEDEKTGIEGDARKLVAKYMETFVREAVARAVVERKGAADEGTDQGIGGDFLEVRMTLEKLCIF